MKDIISNLYNKFLGSLDNEKNKGFSGRKITAFGLVIVVIAIHIKWIVLADLGNIENILIIDYSFISALFGMTTYQSMKEQPKTTTSTIEQEGSEGIKKVILTEESNSDKKDPLV